jgi:hypothetical protein
MFLSLLTILKAKVLVNNNECEGRIFVMKKTTLLVCAGMILAAVCLLIFAGCSNDTPNTQNYDPDPNLINNGDMWTNSLEGGLLRTFVISDTYTFTAHINPPFIMEGENLPEDPTETEWTVEGSL